MRLNIDCIRDIILAIADNLTPDMNGSVPSLDPVKLSQTELQQYPQNEVLYWIKQLMDSGVIVAGKRYIRQPVPLIKDLSLTAYQFIDTVKTPSVWEKIKPTLLTIASGSLSTLLEKAIEIGTSLIP
ncbi:MAG: DUF2513 domain-containing protein [Clostridiales bacterium]|nr:DUF2513 domain-containing protein [Clostridiales bacterium]